MNAFLTEKKEIADNTWWFKFELNNQVKFKPGQIFYLTLPKLKYEDKRGNRRHFSIVNSPTDSTHIEMATRITGSGFKKTLKEMNLNGSVDVSNISGTFILPEQTGKKIVFISLGIGITPFICMLRYIKDKELDLPIVLIYSNQTISSAPFFQELNEYDKKILEFVPIITKDSRWEGEKERINREFITKRFQKPNNNYYMIAGPPNAAFSVKDEIVAAGVDDENVQVEDFYGY